MENKRPHPYQSVSTIAIRWVRRIVMIKTIEASILLPSPIELSSAAVVVASSVMLLRHLIVDYLSRTLLIKLDHHHPVLPHLNIRKSSYSISSSSYNKCYNLHLLQKTKKSNFSIKRTKMRGLNIMFIIID